MPSITRLAFVSAIFRSHRISSSTSLSDQARRERSNASKIELMYIRVNERDNVAIVAPPEGLMARELIPQSHKIALCDFEPGDAILRYGQAIGYANRPIPRGSWVREEMLDMP